MLTRSQPWSWRNTFASRWCGTCRRARSREPVWGKRGRGRPRTGRRAACAPSVCSRDLLRKLLYDADQKVFEATLINPRLTEDDLVVFIESGKASAENLAAIADKAKWSFRYPIRRSLAMNGETPRAVAAAQLRYLQRDDLQRLLRRPETSVYLRRCIEKLGETPHSAR